MINKYNIYIYIYIYTSAAVGGAGAARLGSPEVRRLLLACY